MKMKKRFLGILLSLSLVLGLVPGMSLTAFAATENGVQYLYYENANAAIAGTTTSGTQDCTKVEASSSEVSWTGGWYVVNESVEISGRITVSGTVNLILCDNCKLTASKGITVSSGNTLNIYAQSEDDTAGALEATGGKYAPGIGGDIEEAGGTVTINGGTVNVTGGKYAAGIGGANEGSSAYDGGTVTINGGTVNATGGVSGAGIGGGGGSVGGAGGTVTINGGTVNATGGQSAAGIGGGSGGDRGGRGATVIINGGTVTANGGNNAAGIGAGYGEESGTPGRVTINNGLQVRAGASETKTLVTDFTANHQSYQWASIGIFHTHSFGNSYTPTKTNADNDTITATCSVDRENCDLEAPDYQAKLTILAPAEGSAATLEGAVDFGVTAADIEYYRGTSKLNAPPTEEGFYKAQITVSGVTASITYGVSMVKTDKTYTNDADHGTVTVPGFATVGAAVTVSTTPATGYELKTLTVKKSDDAEVTVTKTGNNGSFTMPEENVTVSAEFQPIPYTISFDPNMSYGTVAASKGQAPVSAENPAYYQDEITLTITPDDGFALKSLSYKPDEGAAVSVTGEGNTRTFTMPASNVTVSATFEGQPFAVTTVSDPTIGGTVSVTGNGVTTNDGTKAKTGTEVTLTATPATGFDLGSVTVTKETGGTVTVTDNKFTMPAEAVTVSATFVGKPVTASLNVTGIQGTTCMAMLTNDSYEEINSVTKNAGEEFTMLLYRDDEYDFKINGADAREFTDEQYQKYLDDTIEQGNFVSLNTVLLHVTMPGSSNGTATITVEFAKQKIYTILYQPVAESNPDMVVCKIVRSVNENEETSYMALKRGASMGDGTAVWSMKMTAAFPPEQIAFVESATIPTTDEQRNTLATTLDNASLNLAAVSQNTDTWNDLSGAKYLIIGGDAKVVTAAFITDPSKMVTYKDNTFDASETTGGATYQLAVVTESDGTVTPGEVTAPAAPAAPEGKEFVGWRGFQYDNNGKASEKIYMANEDNIKVRDNATFTAVWKPTTLKVDLNLNGGTGGTNVTSVVYEEKLKDKISVDPTRNGFAFDGWTVSKSVTEDGTPFAKGSPFDLDTKITADLGLNAQWKHVHSYNYYRVSQFSSLANYHKYDSSIHIAICGCNDIKLVAHEFDSNGKCACGYQKSVSLTVTLNVSYVKLVNGNYTTMISELPETVKKGQEVSIAAPGTWGDLQFSKWQYSTDNTTWADLTPDAYASFLIRADMSVRALYVNPVKQPQVDLSARSYDDHAEVNGKTYTMGNVLFHLNYKLPDGYTFEDAGVRLGDNNGISYYFIQQVHYTYDNESKGIIAAMTAGIVGIQVLGQVFLDSGGDGALGFVCDVTENVINGVYDVNYLETEGNVLDKLPMDASTLAKYMYEFKPVNVEKYPPIYWETKAAGRGMSGSIDTIPPLRFAQKYGGRNYIYGIGYLRYKDKDGNTHTIYTDALPAAVEYMPNYTVTKTGN